MSGAFLGGLAQAIERAAGGRPVEELERERADRNMGEMGTFYFSGRTPHSIK